MLFQSMKINQVTSAVCLFMVSAMTSSLSGCIEKDYDLGDVDTTIGLGAGMTLPSNNSTQDICLDDVLDLGDNNFLAVGTDGEYNIDVMDDDIFTAHMWVDEFAVPSKTYKGTYTINLGDFAPKSPKRHVRLADDDINFNAPMVDMDFTYPYKSSQISRLEYVGVKDGKLTISFAFSNDLKACLSNISQLRVSMPQCIVCGKAAYKGDSIALSADNMLVLNNVNPAEGATFAITIKGIDLTSKKSDGSYMTFTKGEGLAFHGSLLIGVTVKESAVDFDKVAESKDLSVSGNAVLSRMLVKSARGGFTPKREFGRVGGVSLRNAPSFLRDDEVNLDLYDPQLNINILSNVPFANKMTGAIVSKDMTGKVIHRIDVPEFSYKANGESVISVRRRPASTPSDTTVIVIHDICDVIRNLPDSIALIDLVGVGDDSQTADIELDKNYRGTIRLSVASGIALADDAVVVYKDDYSGWNDQFKDISFVETVTDGTKKIEGYLKVISHVENKIPAYLNLTAAGIDITGNIIPRDRLEVEVENAIKASHDGKTPVETELVIYVRPKDNEVFKTLDGLTFRIAMTAQDKKTSEKVTGVKLNAYQQTVKVKDLKIQKYGKVAIDLN